MSAPQTTYAVPQIEISKTVLDRDRRDVVPFSFFALSDVFMLFFARGRMFDHTRVNFATAQDRKKHFALFSLQVSRRMKKNFLRKL